MVQRYSYVLWRKPCLHISRVAESSRAHGHGTDGCSLQLECQYRAPLSPLDEHSRADQSWTEQGPLATLQNTLQTPRPHSRCCSSEITLLHPRDMVQSVSRPTSKPRQPPWSGRWILVRVEPGLGNRMGESCLKGNCTRILGLSQFHPSYPIQSACSSWLHALVGVFSLLFFSLCGYILVILSLTCMF